MNESELETAINVQKLGYEFLDKPVLVGGLAMEYYGLRKHGDDVIRFVVNKISRISGRTRNNHEDRLDTY